MRLIELSENIETFWDEIESNCSDIFKLMYDTKECLYRGASGKPEYFKAVPRENRSPRDSNHEGQIVYDFYLDKLGIKAKRSNSIFVTNDFNHAKDFGSVYVIFPVDGFSYSWSQTESDIIITKDDLERYVNYELVDKLFDELNAKRIQVVWDSYYLMHSISKILQHVDDDKLEPKDFLNYKALDEKYKATNTDIQIPMSKEIGWEIAINSPYYAINYSKYNMFLEEKFPEIFQ